MDASDGVTFRAICFHDVRDRPRAERGLTTLNDPYTVDIDTLTSIFSWLEVNRYHPVSLDAVLAARSGGTPLPPRAILLSFDDGFRSHHEKVLPLLKQFAYPAVMAIVTSWIDTPAGAEVRLSDRLVVPRDTFMSWSEVRDVLASGLVELACHTHDLHHGAVANPQGNELPAATSHLYPKARSRYETDAEFQSRVRDDLGLCLRRVKQNTGRALRAMMWPYGAQNQTVRAIASDLGMHAQFTLASGSNTGDVPLDRLRRILATADIDAGELERAMREPADNRGRINPAERVVVVSLDDIYDPAPEVQEKKLGDLIERMYRLRPSSVYLQAFSDPSKSGVAQAVYFPNRHLPMRADLFSRAAWQLKTRALVDVYAWMPVLAFAPPAALKGRAPFIACAAGGSLPPGALGMPRLSPFNPAVRAFVREMYEDLGKYAAFAGVLFGPDAMLGEFEDTGRHARETYVSWGLPSDVEQIRANPDLARRWGDLKTRHLIDFTKELGKIVLDSQSSGDVLTVRTIFPEVVLDAPAGRRYAQDYAAFLGAYDFVGLLALSSRQGDKARDEDDRLDRLVERVRAAPAGPRHTVFLLEATDSRTAGRAQVDRLTAQMRRLRQAGMTAYGYDRDDFEHDQPDALALREVMSVRARLDPDAIKVLVEGQAHPGARR
ncbi:poly-beta-1,6-N-acetyl-D-glucosamine N-deacetylase PgaB, partial [Burkholderia gladioli]